MSSNEKYGRRKRKNGIEANTGDWQGFVDVSLDDNDRAIIQETLHASEFGPDEFLIDALEAGYKVSLSPDATHQCVVATLTGRSPHCPNVGYSLVARGPDIVGALCALDHKHTAICKRGKWLESGGAESKQMRLFD
jgi:hypothetical protein